MATVFGTVQLVITFANDGRVSSSASVETERARRKNNSRLYNI